MNLAFPAEELAYRAEKIMADPECGSVFRIKGFGKNREGQWTELNAARGKVTLRPISEGRVVLSRCDEVSEEQKRAVTEHLERAIENVRCRRTSEGEILSKDCKKLTDQDYDRLLK